MRGAWIGLAAVLLAGCSMGKDVPLAEAAASDFHLVLNNGGFAQIYNGASNDLRSTTPQAKLTAILDAVHRKLGKFQSASTTGWNDNYTNGDHFIVLNQASKYAQGEAQERFVYRIAGGKAALVGYQVNSDTLITG